MLQLIFWIHVEQLKEKILKNYITLKWSVAGPKIYKCMDLIMKTL